MNHDPEDPLCICEECMAEIDRMEENDDDEPKDKETSHDPKMD